MDQGGWRRRGGAAGIEGRNALRPAPKPCRAGSPLHPPRGTERPTGPMALCHAPLRGRGAVRAWQARTPYWVVIALPLHVPPPLLRGPLARSHAHNHAHAPAAPATAASFHLLEQQVHDLLARDLLAEGLVVALSYANSVPINLRLRWEQGHGARTLAHGAPRPRGKMPTVMRSIHRHPRTHACATLTCLAMLDLGSPVPTQRRAGALQTPVARPC
jgi:hypothetical protein